MLGEIGVGNTTVAAALACALTGLDPAEAVGLGAGADAAILERKRDVVAAALLRCGPALAGSGSPADQARQALAGLGGPEIAVLTGVVLGAVEAGAPVVLDGLAGSLPGCSPPGSSPRFRPIWWRGSARASGPTRQSCVRVNELR